MRYGNLSILLTAILLAAGPAAAGEEPRVLATYRRGVTEAELESWLGFTDSKGEDRELALRELVLSRALAAEALRLGLDREPLIRLELERQDAAQVRPLLHRQVNDSIRFTGEEVEAKVRSGQGTFGLPRRVRLRNLFKRYPPGAGDAEKAAVRARMEELRRRLVVGADFAETAAAESDSQTRLQGGLLGNVRVGTLRADMEAVALALKAGEISEILAGPDGLTIFYCEQILEAKVPSAEEIRDIARQRLRNRAYYERWARLEQEMLEAAAPVYHWQVLADEPHDETRSSMTLVAYTGGVLSLAEVRAIVGGREAPDLAEVPRETIVERVETHLKKIMVRREVVVRGLVDEAVETRRALKRRQILAAKALVHLIQERVTRPTGEEIEAYFRAHRDEYERPVHYRLAVIALPLDPDDVRGTYRLGERLVHRLETGELRFEEAARRYSEDSSAENGGDAGWVSRWAVPSRYGIDFLRALLAMEIGARSDLVLSEEILWIFELRGIEEERPMTLEEARIGVENRLGNQRVRALEAEIVDQWMEKLGIELLH